MAEKEMSLRGMLQRAPHAHARVRGNAAYPGIKGKVDFYQTDQGVVVLAEIAGLPVAESDCGNSVFGFHIHEGSKCEGNAEDPFAEVGQHYNPGNCPHPAHAGDLPPLFSNKGYAIQMFLTDRFTVEEIRDGPLSCIPDRMTLLPSPPAMQERRWPVGKLYRGSIDFYKSSRYTKGQTREHDP